MSTHEDRKVHRVTSEADARIRAYAREKGITAFDAASMWQPPSKQGAESSTVSMADFEAMKADRDRLKIEAEEADEARRAAEERADDKNEPDPRVSAYAEERAMSYADALEFMITMADRRIQSLKKYAGKGKAA